MTSETLCSLNAVLMILLKLKFKRLTFFAKPLWHIFSVENSTVRTHPIYCDLSLIYVDFLKCLCGMIMMAATHFSPVRADMLKEQNGNSISNWWGVKDSHI